MELSASLSYISADKAREIYGIELEGRDFDAVQAASKAVWEDLLGRVKIRGGTEDQKTVYYTALYRSFGKMYDYGEYGSYYSGYDNAVHAGDSFYTVDQLWDSFRSMHPLQLLLEPKRHEKMLASYVAFRQVYLYVTRLLGIGFNAVALAYPMGWILCTILLAVSYHRSCLCREEKSPFASKTKTPSDASDRSNGGQHG